MEKPQRFPKGYRVMLDMAYDQTGYDEDQIADLLKARFGAFNNLDTTKYLNYIVAVWQADQEKTPLDKKVKQILDEAKQKSLACPMCGAPTRGAHKIGKYTGREIWECTEGGSLHYMHHTTNQIFELQGKEVPFKYGDWEKEKDVEADPGNDEGRNTEHRPSDGGGDTISDTRVEVPEQSSAERIQASPYAHPGDLSL